MTKDSLECVMAAFTLPTGMEWLETRLEFQDGAVRPTLVKDGFYRVISFTKEELRGLKLTYVTSKLRNEIALFQASLKVGSAKKLTVEKGEGIE